MIKKWFLIISSLVWAVSLQAGVTGKIAGKIADAQTKQPIPGVNILVEGTSMGSITDVNGQYTILNIPPGNYTVRASMIGYTTVRVEGVKVSIDLTTRVNVNLSSEVLNITDAITVVAQRPMIQKDEVATKHYISTEEIELQPVDSFQEIARNQAGVVGNHFRGGRGGDVLVLVDGIPVRDPSGEYAGNLGGFTSSVPNYGIEEMEVALGGFGAEYGNVQSGVLNLAMKEGASRYNGRFRVSTTDFGSASVNTPFNRKIYEAAFSGPVPLAKGIVPGSLSFSLSGELTDQDHGWYSNQYTYDRTLQGKLTWRISPSYKLTYGTLYNQDDWDQHYFYAAKYGPGAEYQQHQYQYVDNATLYNYLYVTNPAEFKARQGSIDAISGTYNGKDYNRMQTYYVGGMQDYLWNYEKRSNTNYLIWTHALNPRTYYEIRAQHFFSNYQYATPDVEDRDNDGNTTENLVWDSTQPGPHPIYRERENNLWWVRGDDPGYLYQASWTKSVKADLVSQVNQNHLLKGGIEFYDNRTKVENISWTLALETQRKDIWDEDAYDLGAYLQDKLEFEGIIALIGLRYDAFNPNGLGDPIYYPSDFANPFSQVVGDVPVLLDPQKPSIKHQLSPRIGISHPITDRDVIHYTYGHYFQRPDLYWLFRNNKYQALTKVGNNIGNPNLNPEKTVAYEIGLEHQFNDDIKGTVTGYYKDISNLVDWMKYVGRSIQNIEMNVFTNADYGNVKGLEFTLSKRLGRYWGGTVNYTYSVAKGRSSDAFGGYGSFTDAKRMNLLDYDQTHTINANISLRTPGTFGPKFAGIRPLANWQSNIQFAYGSGLPYSSYGTNKVNDQRLPWTSTTDLKLMRQFALAPLKLDLFIDVFNLFDRKNVNYINSAQYYEITGDPSVIMLDVDGVNYIRNPQVWDNGRQVRAGVAIQL
ncbi:MAG TPA: TonB-dependent receptor [bacterium]|nr:TonB-dependent receptor [bacterium]HPR88946.1 TonB-dependent receptor [bacterium]